MTTKNQILFLVITLCLVMSQPNFLFAYEDSFSCPYGKRAACLDSNDKVCSYSAKCVSNDSICFDSYTCDYNGFTCKSNLDSLASEYDTLVNNYNNLRNEYESLQGEFEDSQGDYDELESCGSYASSLYEAKSCY